MPMPRFSTGTAVTSSPSTKMRPLVGCSKPASMGSVVVLPEAEGPRRGKDARAPAHEGREVAGRDLGVEGAHGVDLAVIALADVDEPDQRFRTSRAHASRMGRTFRRCRANSVPDFCQEIQRPKRPYPPHWCLLIPAFVTKVR